MNPPALAFFGTGRAGLAFAAGRPGFRVAIFVTDWDDVDRTRLAVALAGQHPRIRVHHVDAAAPSLLARFSHVHAAA